MFSILIIFIIQYGSLTTRQERKNIFVEPHVVTKKGNLKYVVVKKTKERRVYMAKTQNK